MNLDLISRRSREEAVAMPAPPPFYLAAPPAALFGMPPGLFGTERQKKKYLPRHHQG